MCDALWNFCLFYSGIYVYMSIKLVCNVVTYIIHEVHLLAGDVGAIGEGEWGIWCKSCHMTQPDFEEANFDEDQLVVLTQVTETYKKKENPYPSLHAHFLQSFLSALHFIGFQEKTSKWWLFMPRENKSYSSACSSVSKNIYIYSTELYVAVCLECCCSSI